MDEDDDMSEGEKEMMAEIDDAVDGKVKISKNMRGYDDQDQGAVEKEEESVEGNANMEVDSEGAAEGVEKYTKPLRETHAKYAQYLRHIDFSKQSSSASVDIAFPLDFKKVLMLTVAEQTMAKVLVRSVPNIEKCTLIKPKKESDEPYLIV